MKTLGLLVILILGIAGANRYDSYQQSCHRADMIREHKFALAWPMDDVRASLGEPVGRVPLGEAGERWLYPSVVIDFGHGRVINSSPTRISATVPAHTPYPGRKISYVEGLGYIEHDADVSAMQSVGLGGGGGGGRTLARTPDSNAVTKQWGWKSTTSSLDKPAHR